MVQDIDDEQNVCVETSMNLICDDSDLCDALVLAGFANSPTNLIFLKLNGGSRTVCPTSTASGLRGAKTNLVTRQRSISKETATRVDQHRKKPHVNLIRRDPNECWPRRKCAKEQLILQAHFQK